MKTLSLGTLRLLHRYIDDFTVFQRIRDGSMAPVELERLLRQAGADPVEINEILSDYRESRTAP